MRILLFLLFSLTMTGLAASGGINTEEDSDLSSPAECKQMTLADLPEKFNALDANGDEFLDYDELLVAIDNFFDFKSSMEPDEVYEVINSFYDIDSILVRDHAIRIFVDCYRCDMNYIRREIPYVNYVRDVKEAQVYILETSQETGSGGKQFTFFFEGQENFSGMHDTLIYATSPDDTDEIERQGRTQMLKMGLMRFVARTPLQNEINISARSDLEQDEVIDKWNNWVFELRTSPRFRGEDSYSDFSIWNSVRAVKITNEWKIEADYDHSYNITKYIHDDTLHTKIKSSNRLDNLIVKSFGEHWSAGIRMDLNSSTFKNQYFNLDFLPSVEYNIFPYSQSTQRQLRLMYSVGNSFNIYNDTTIYDKIRENLYLQQLRVAFEVKDKWGSVNVSLSAANYFHDFSKNRVDLFGFIEVRIIKGLSVRLYGGVSRINDQLSLAKEELSEADILLRLSELETSYQVNGSVSLTYTFGSIYNNIVNPRFGNGDGGGGGGGGRR